MKSLPGSAEVKPDRLCQQRIKNAGNEQAADALDYVSGNAGCSSSEPIDWRLAQQIPCSHHKNIQDATAHDGRPGGFYFSAQIQGKPGGQKGHKALYCKGNRNIDKIAPQKIGQTGTDARGQKSPSGGEEQAAQDHDSVAGMTYPPVPGVGIRITIVAVQTKAAKRAAVINFFTDCCFMSYIPSFL